jgi:hypothetical protein
MIWSLLAQAAAKFFLGGPAKRPTQLRRGPLPEILTMPVIFANGRDDDTEGVKAFLENRRLIYRGAVIQPGDHTLKSTALCFSVCAIFVKAGGQIVGVIGYPAPGQPIATVDVSHGAHRCVESDVLRFGCKVQP